MDDPAQQNEPEGSREKELNNRQSQPTLEKLTQAGNEDTRERCDHITG